LVANNSEITLLVFELAVGVPADCLVLNADVDTSFVFFLEDRSAFVLILEVLGEYLVALADCHVEEQHSHGKDEDNQSGGGERARVIDHSCDEGSQEVTQAHRRRKDPTRHVSHLILTLRLFRVDFQADFIQLIQQREETQRHCHLLHDETEEGEPHVVGNAKGSDGAGDEEGTDGEERAQENVNTFAVVAQWQDFRVGHNGNQVDQGPTHETPQHVLVTILVTFQVHLQSRKQKRLHNNQSTCHHSCHHKTTILEQFTIPRGRQIRLHTAFLLFCNLNLGLFGNTFNARNSSNEVGGC